MNKPPAYQRYPKDWLSSVTRKMMCKAARSAYTDLMDHCWENGCKLPNDPESLRILADCTVEEWSNFGEQILQNFFVDNKGFISNKKLRKQWRDLMSFRRSRMIAGKASAKARTRVQHTSNSASASASASATKTLNTNTPLPPTQNAGGTQYFQWGGEVIEVQIGRKRRILTERQMETARGMRAEEMADYLRSHGMPARIMARSEYETAEPSN